MNCYSFKKIACAALGFLCCFSAFAAQTETAYTSYSRYDERGLLLGTISATSVAGYVAVRNTYTNGFLTKVEKGSIRPGAWETDTVKPKDWIGFSVSSSQVITYDTYGRKETITTFDNTATAVSLTQLNYDADSNVRCKATRMNSAVYGSLPDACSLSTQGANGPDRITQTTYDEFDQPLNISNSVGTPTYPDLYQNYVTNTYKGRYLESQTDANGNRTELRYNANGRLERMVYPSPTVTGSVNDNDYVYFEYDAAGNKTLERKRNGALINFTIDNNNRPIVKDYVDNTRQRDIYYDYDLRGLQLLASFDTSSTADRTEQRYDAFGNLTKDYVAIGGVGRSIRSKYDLDNNRTVVTHQDTNYYTYQYDQLDRLGVIYEGGGTRMLQIDYQPNGHRKRIYRRGGVSSTNFSFTNGLQMDGFTQDFTNNTYDLTNTFKYNPAGQIAQLTQSNNLYFFSGNENITGNYTVDGLNRYTYVGGVTQQVGQPMGYDDKKGNLTNDGRLTYQYDDENRLVSTGGAVVSSFVYDPRGRLFQSIIDGIKTQFLYDGDALVAEYDGAGVMQRRYIHGNRVDEPLVQYNSNVIGLAAWRYLHTDHQGSIIAQSDVSGNVLNTSSYDIYGIPRTGNNDRFGYTGQIWFKELGLSYYKARVYHPKLGRFLQTDPIGYKDSMNLYVYVGNDPINKTDPTGMYGKGNGFTDDQWKRFDKIQQKAAGRMESRAGKMEAKADKLDAKGKTGGDTLRATAGYLRGGAASLRSNGSDGKMANAVSGDTYVSMGGSRDGGAFVPKGDKNTVVVNSDNQAAWSGRNAGWSIGHESLHSTGVGLNDQRGSNNERAYKQGNEEQRASYEELKGTDAANINPDHIMDLVY